MTLLNTQTKQRLPYIDIMKGVCIILIVGIHISFGIFPGQFNAMLQAFRVPLYYFLSGLFFKDYGGFGEFTRKKTNNILVPFLFFYLIACGLSIVCCELLHLDDKGMLSESWQWSYLLDPLTIREYHYGAVLWFLPSLFEVNIIYYLMQRYLSQKAIYIVAGGLSFFGWYCPHLGIYLPLMLDTAFVALPFFILGCKFRQIDALKKTKYDRLGLVLILPVMVILYFFAVNMSILHQRYPGYFNLYLLSSVAMITLFLFAKNLPKIPVISYIGRYSIIVLGTHTLILVPIRMLYFKYLGEHYWVYWAILATVIAIELLIIPVMIRLFPRFTAQKPLFGK